MDVMNKNLTLPGRPDRQLWTPTRNNTRMPVESIWTPGESNLTWTPGEVEGVMIGQAPDDGPTVGVMAAIHPDETAGTEILQSLVQDLSLKRGTVIAMLGNLKAMRTGKRQFDVNQNRVMLPLTVDQKLRNFSDLPYEVGRAWELMDYMDLCDAIIDLHEYEDPRGTPYIIGERDSLALARKIGPAVMAFGFATAEPGGTDGYAHSQGIPLLCYEIGTQGGRFQRQNVRFGWGALERFFAANDMTDVHPEPLYEDPLLVQVGNAYPKTSPYFEMAKQFKSFEVLQPGQLVATDGSRQIRAANDRQQVILFAKPDEKVRELEMGREAFAIGDRVNE